MVYSTINFLLCLTDADKKRNGIITINLIKMEKTERILQIILELDKLTMIRQLEITDGFTDEQLCRLTSVK